MPKEIPACPKKPNPTVEEGRSYKIELITPIFGGGVEPRVNDPSFPIRPTTIRGQLQFWWRATAGRSTQPLRNCGRPNRQSGAQRNGRAGFKCWWRMSGRATRHRARSSGISARRGQGGWRTNWQAPFNGQDSALPYALFPFQGETPPPNRNATVTVPPAPCIRQANFRLTIRCPNDLWPQVEPAVWAWVNFGGLGGRTRRGCGAIRCKASCPRGSHPSGRTVETIRTTAVGASRMADGCRMCAGPDGRPTG